MRSLLGFSESKHRRLFRLLLLALGAFLCGLTLVCQKLDLIEWVSLIPMAIALYDIAADKSVRKRGLYAYGLFFYFCFFAVNFHWFINLYPLDFIDGMTKPAAVLVVLSGCVGLAFLQALFGGLVFLAFGVITRYERFSGNTFFSALLAASLWSILEWSQTLGWIGVPWARLAIGQTGFLVGAQSASLLGSCFVTFLIVFVNFLLAGAFISLSGKKLLALSAAGVFVVNTLLGTVLYFRNTEKGEAIKVSAVQGNISSQEKWNFSLLNKTLEVYEEYTREAAEAGAQIVVWPESALPYDVTYDTILLDYARDLARENKVTILVGAFTSEGDNEYNSIIAVLPDGKVNNTIYSKRHLVPFGEYVPMVELFETLIPPLADLSMRDEDLSEGEGANIFCLEDVNIGSLMCFDSIYDELARNSALSGAQIFAVSTNDSWFSDSAALRMHNAQAALRSIENGRYTVRAANTGISSVIAPNGNILEELGTLEEGQLCAEIYARDTTTPYTYLGNSFVYLCIIFIVFCWLYEKATRKVGKKLDKL